VADDPFGDMLKQLADVTGGAPGGGGLGDGLGTGSGLPDPYSLMNPAILGLSEEQLRKVFSSMSDNERDMYLRQLLKIPSVTEQQQVLDPYLDLATPRFQIRQLDPPMVPWPSRMPMIQPDAAPPTWSWPL